MVGFQQFLNLCGNMTVLNMVEIILAGMFLWFVYKKIKEYFIKIHDEEVERNEQIKEALLAVRKYPEYRQQSLDIQQKLEGEIQALRISQEKNEKRLEKMEEDTKMREQNKLRDRLIQNYRYYTNKHTNPSQTWTKMESEAFWALFKDYEESGGNGYMHTEVQPAMNKLLVVDMINDEAK